MRLPTILACLFTAIAAATASAQPAPAQDAPPIGVPGGLTADQVAATAVTRSPDLTARRADVGAADAGVRQALDAYIPHAELTARYLRLSRIDAPSLGNIVVAPSAGALPLDATLVSVPLAFPVLLDQTTFEAQIDVPVSVGIALTWTIGDAPRQLDAAKQLRARADGVEAERARLVDGVRLESRRRSPPSTTR